MSLLRLINNQSKYTIYSIYYCENGYCNTFKCGNQKTLGEFDLDLVGNPYISREIVCNAFAVEKSTNYLAFSNKGVLQISELSSKFLSQQKTLPWLNVDLTKGLTNKFFRHDCEILLVPKGYYKDAINIKDLQCDDTELTAFKGLRIESDIVNIYCKFPNIWPELSKRTPYHLFTFYKHNLLIYDGWQFYFTSIKVKGQKSYSWYKQVFHENPSLTVSNTYLTEKVNDNNIFETDLDKCSGYDFDIEMFPHHCREIITEHSEIQVVPMNKINNSIILSSIENYWDSLNITEQSEYESYDVFVDIWANVCKSINMSSMRHDLKSAPIVAYDTETCVNPQLGAIRPYLVHFYSETLNYNKSIFNTNKLYCTCKWRSPSCSLCKPGDVFELAGDALVEIMLEAWKQKYNMLVLVGFNNFKFDNNVFLGECIMKALPLSLMLGKYQFGFSNFKILNQESARNNKSNMWQTDVYFYDEYETVDKYERFCNTFTIYVKDCVTFIPDKTLLQACEDYGVKMSKIDFDIVKANEVFEQENSFVSAVEGQIQDYFKSKLSNLERVKLSKQFLDANKKIKLADLTKYYCEMDTKATYELFTQVVDNVAKIINITPRKNNILQDSCLYYLSIPNLAFEIFKELIDPETETCVLKLPSDFRAKIEESCFGGRCDYTILGEYKTNKQLTYIDVTSEYPLAMLGYFPVFSSIDDLLIGQQVDVQYYQCLINESYQIRCEHFNEKKLKSSLPWKLPLGFFCCNFFPPDEGRLISFGPIAYRETEKLFYTNNTQYNRYLNTIQIRLLIYCGWKVELLPSKFNLLFKRKAQIFKEFVDFTGKLKTEAREENKSLAKLLKLIMNSIAGKLGQKSYHDLKKSKYEFINDKKQLTKNITEYKNVDSKAQMHFLASFVWSYANQILYTTMFHLNENLINEQKPLSMKTGALLYCDTDSIIFDKSVATHYDFVISEALGTFDTETLEFQATWKAKYTGIDNLIVCCKKVYACVDNNKLLLKRAKGVHGKAADEHCTLEYFRELLEEGKSKKIDIEMFKKSGNTIKDDTFSLFRLDFIKTEKQLSIRTDECFEIENQNPLNKELNQRVRFCVSRLDDLSKRINQVVPLNLNQIKDDYFEQGIIRNQQFVKDWQEYKKQQKTNKLTNERNRKRRHEFGSTDGTGCPSSGPNAKRTPSQDRRV